MKPAVPLWRWAVWLLFLAAWSFALLIPFPESGPLALQQIGVDRKYIISKTVHVSIYALFAGLTGWLRVPAPRRWLLMFFLMAHGTLTELLQLAMDRGRTGCLEDVGFDHAGVAIGALLTWNWWTAADPAPQTEGQRPANRVPGGASAEAPPRPATAPPSA